LERPNGMSMIGMVLLEERRNPELATLFRQRMILPRRERLMALFQQGVGSGEIRPDADVATAVAMAIGSFYAHYLVTGAVPKTWERRTVAMLRTSLY
jgi:hypothetical protein